MPEQAEPAPDISVQQAVQTAIQYFQTLSQQPIIDLAVEEVEKVENNRYWAVTLGYQLARTGFVGPSVLTRQYKVIKIHVTTGEPVSMKIKKL